MSPDGYGIINPASKQLAVGLLFRLFYYLNSLNKPSRKHG
jgi:hypothetical protein